MIEIDCSICRFDNFCILLMSNCLNYCQSKSKNLQFYTNYKIIWSTKNNPFVLNECLSFYLKNSPGDLELDGEKVLTFFFSNMACNVRGCVLIPFVKTPGGASVAVRMKYQAFLFLNLLF